MLKPYSKLHLPIYAGKPSQTLQQVIQNQYHRRPFADIDMLKHSFVYLNSYVPDSQLWIPNSFTPSGGDNKFNEVKLYNIDDEYVTHVIGDMVEYTSAYGDRWLMLIGGMDYDSYPEPGLYYLVIEADSGRFSVSEVFRIGCEDEFQKLIKLEYWNTTDVANILYRDSYINTLYVENGLRYMGSTIEEEVSEDENNRVTPTHQVYYENYELQLFVMPHQADALMMLKMHDNVYITRPENGIRGRIEVQSVSYEPQNDKEWGVLILQFREYEYIVKTGCGEFIPLVS